MQSISISKCKSIISKSNISKCSISNISKSIISEAQNRTFPNRSFQNRNRSFQNRIESKGKVIMGRGLRTQGLVDSHQFLLFTWLARPRLAFLGFSRESRILVVRLCGSSLGSVADPASRLVHFKMSHFQTAHFQSARD